MNIKGKKLKIMFMGTPAFAVASLDKLVRIGYNVCGVVTVPDKPAGRGRKLSQSAVKKYAEEKGLYLLQPANLSDEKFVAEVEDMNPDITVVVAFRMLPEVVWKIPQMGTFNLHASLLPQYRGAAPINRAVMNGERVTGLTTFFIDHKIDTGAIILQQSVEIMEDETAGELHDRMLPVGADLVANTVELIALGKVRPIPQNISESEILKPAPKIFKAETAIDWTRPAQEIHNKIRGLSPHPAATTTLVHPEKGELNMRIFRSKLIEQSGSIHSPEMVTDGKSFIHIQLPDGGIELLDIQVSDRKRMPAGDFLRGFSLETGWNIENRS